MADVCPICNNPLRQYSKDFHVCEVCETYFYKDKNIVLTEQEWLQTATTEQLAELLYNIRYDYQVPWKNKSIVEWLKQPHLTSK